MTRIELERLKNINVNTIDRTTVAKPNKLNIDTSLPIEERYRNLLKCSGNPYFFLCNDTVVKVEFSDNDLSLQEVLSDTLIRKKNR